MIGPADALRWPRVYSRAAIESGAAQGAVAAISIRSSRTGEMPALDRALYETVDPFGPGILRLAFDDIGLATYGRLRGPSMEQVAQAIDLGRAVRHEIPIGTIAVHCEYGRSRSSAIALALLADEAGPGGEAEAVNALLRDDTEDHMQPNPRIVALADAVLLRCGALETALIERCARYRAWRDYWRRLELQPDPPRKPARRARSRRSSAPAEGA